MSTATKALIAVAVVFGLIVVAGILAAIAIPAFLNQRDRALQAELESAVRNAAIEVEAAVTATGGGYDDIPDFEGLVQATLVWHSDARIVADFDSADTFATDADFGICAEHVELPGSVTYLSDRGLQDYVDGPCP